uniref:zinc finger protein 106 n=1 Tax=Gasterosteus aculeatus aculeatus TaxID=481459 RepID=UPI001A9967BC|nr:zinc finger protein 106 [Gasterosteus aculeatus aculeatus]
MAVLEQKSGVSMINVSEMSKIKTSRNAAAKSPAKKILKGARVTFCELCRRTYYTPDAQGHVHSMLHHIELEAVLGKGLFHECLACKASPMDLNKYSEHITSDKHLAKLKSLMEAHVKPISLLKILGQERLLQIRQRNRTLRKEARKEGKKKKKKGKQTAARERPKPLIAKNTTKRGKQEKATPVKSSLLLPDTHKQGKNNAVCQNKENKVSSLQSSLCQRESTPQNQSRLVSLSEDPAGQTLHHSTVRDQSTQSAQQLVYSDFSIQIKSSPTERPCKRQKQREQQQTTKKLQQNMWPTITQDDYYNKQDDGEFTSDHLPYNGAIIFGQDQVQGPESSQSAQRASAQTASANGNANAAPIRDVDVSTMLRQIRRALGVRELCRADREARKQKAEAGVLVSAGDEKCKPTGASPQVGKSGQSGPVSNVTSSKQKRRYFEMAQGCQDSLDSKTPLSPCPPTSSEPNLNIRSKVRISRKFFKEDGAKPTTSKLNLSGAESNPSGMGTYEELKRRKQESGSGTPRFGIELANPLSDQESATQANDPTTSEGFHWETFSEGPSGEPLLSPPPRNTTHNERETQPDAPNRGPLEQRGAARGLPVKVEPTLEGVVGDLRANCSAIKRKPNVADDISHMQPSGKKKKSKSNNDQGPMDQLLAVSLREDELSHSLQDLDRSLVQARNSLQAAYTEVQRLLLMRQQFSVEVNNLRAQRIEILQGMQGGYSGAEKATTSSAGAAATAHPRHSPLLASVFPTSSRQQSSPTVPPSSISPLALPTIPVKQELFKGVLQLHATLPVLPFPPNLPSPRLPSPSLAATAPAATAVKRVKAECSEATGANAWQQTATSASGETPSADDDSVGETEGNLCREREEVEDEPTAQIAADDDEGSESEASVEMMEPGNLVVIDVDESGDSDSEDGPDSPAHQESPQRFVSVELNSSSTQTLQQSDVERKVQPTHEPVKDPSSTLDEDEEPSVGSFLSHTGPVHGLQIHNGRLYTCSGDNTARAYCLMTKECKAFFVGHTNKVNCLLVSSVPKTPSRLFTGASDKTIRCYSIKTTKCLDQLSLTDRVLCLHIAWNILYAGLADGSVASYDLKTMKHLDVFECHGPRGVSCLGTSQEGARRVLLVGSYDNSISVRDAKSGLLLRTLQGHTKTVLCMKVVNDLVFSGSSDTSVHAHNIHTGELVRIYKGHDHAVTSIVILGKVMVTACLDKLVRVYELQSHDRLQVYGGHTDMVMCMAVYKSVVYTGCYDGTVQAVKLNLMKNYRCWWQNCALIFGNPEHLLQHLVSDHSNLNLPAAKCRWKRCHTFFSTPQSVQQKLPEHMRNHVDNDSKVQP